MKRILALLCLCLGSMTTAWGSDLSLVVGYPYLALKYDVVPAASVEAKAAFGDGVTVLAGRGYWNFYQDSSLRAFTGLEVGSIGFNTLGINGQGFETGLFLGGAYAIMPSFGVTLDIGPTLIQLNSQETTSSGLEWVVTAGVYIGLF
jgi:hypothetical protein